MWVSTRVPGSRPRDAGTAAAIVLEESPLSQGARQRRGVWELMKQGPQFATRTVEAKARMRFSYCTTRTR
ncbi:hypothetical protein DZD52_01490 [Xanthomonas nasturtii]|uniref:Uncharacterized protein n=1 Tax=Xanthomonas nasturtii TaxID=1843581 RepID=A0A3E1KSH9_9XANT|nr:hypothetical protein DZD52_01490 [Xanthomonas nasturtii]